LICAFVRVFRSHDLGAPARMYRYMFAHSAPVHVFRACDYFFSSLSADCAAASRAIGPDILCANSQVELKREPVGGQGGGASGYLYIDTHW